MTTVDVTSIFFSACCKASDDPMASPSGDRCDVMTTRLCSRNLRLQCHHLFLGKHIFHEGKIHLHHGEYMGRSPESIHSIPGPGLFKAKALEPASNAGYRRSRGGVHGDVFGHDFHFSRTDMRWNPRHKPSKPRSAFSPTTSNWPSKPPPFGRRCEDLAGDEREWTADDALFAWLSHHLDLQLGDSTVHWTWVGKEVELDVSYLYLESSPAPASERAWTVTNTLFFPEFGDQVNEMHLHSVGLEGTPLEKRDMLNWEWSSFVWDPQRPEEDPDHD